MKEALKGIVIGGLIAFLFVAALGGAIWSIKWVVESTAAPHKYVDTVYEDVVTSVTPAGNNGYILVQMADGKTFKTSLRHHVISVGKKNKIVLRRDENYNTDFWIESVEEK